MDEDLKKVFPEEEYVLKSGEKVMVSPVPFGKLKVFGEAIASLSGKLQTSDLGGDLNNPAEIGRIMALAFEEVVKIMGIVLGKDIEWFNTITVPDGVGLGMLILRQNFDEDTKKKVSDLLAKMRQDLPS